MAIVATLTLAIAFILALAGRVRSEANDSFVDIFPGDCDKANVPEEAVFKFLANSNPDYVADARPRKNSRETVKVTFSLQLMSLKDFNEPEGTLLLDGYFTALWKNEFLVWNSTFPYRCVEWLTFRDRPIWRPYFVVLTNGNDNFAESISNSVVLLRSNGHAEMYPIGQFTSSCELDVTNFPFDNQICKITVENWVYDVSMQQLVLDPEGAFAKVRNFWTENRQWEVINLTAEYEGANYSSTDASYSRIYLKLFLRRKPMFFYANVVIPSLVIAVVELVIFFLPNDEVEKLSISVTCLLAYSVFQSMIINDMPKNGKRVPLLSIYINLQMAYIGFIAVLSEGLVFYISNKATAKSEKCPPEWILNLTALIGKRVLRRHQHHSGKPPADKVAEKTCEDPEDKASADGAAKTSEPAGEATLVNKVDVITDRQNEWSYIADVINRLNLVLYVLAIVLTPISLFVISPLTAPVTKL